MQTYAILRRRGWRTPEELEAAAMRSRQVGDEQMPDARWIRSYALAEEDGTVGTVCIYQATDAESDSASREDRRPAGRRNRSRRRHRHRSSGPRAGSCLIRERTS